MAAHWPWYTDPVVMAEIQKIITKVDALASMIKTQHVKEMTKMSALSDLIRETDVEADAALARVAEDVAALVAKIAELQAQIDAGTATPADFEALAVIKSKLAALDPTKPDTLSMVKKRK